MTNFRFVKAPLYIVLFSMSSSGVASEGSYSNNVPGFYGDLALVVDPEQGLAEWRITG